MVPNKALSLLSLAMKAGKVVSGEFMTEKEIKSGKAKLVIVASDASENTKKMFRNMSEYRHVEMIEFGDKESLGRAIGKEMRASLAIIDEGFAKNIMKQAGL